MITETFFSSLMGVLLVAALAGGLPASRAGAAENVSPACSKSEGPGKGLSMRVLWTVSGYVRGRAAALGDEEAGALLFKPLDIDDSVIVFDGKTCKGVKFEKEQVNTAAYLKGRWDITPQALGLNDPQLQVVKTNCDLPGFKEYMQLNDRRLIVPINGVFFFFEPAVAY